MPPQNASKQIQEKIVGPEFDRRRFGTYGIIIDFDQTTRFAHVLLAAPGHDGPGEIVKNVPCPTMLGVQSVDPRPGQGCWVQFKDGQSAFPMIVSFWNKDYNETDWMGHQSAPSVLPRYMTS